MDEVEQNIEIRIRYADRDAFPADAIAKTIEHIDAIVLEQEGRQLETLARDIEDIPPVALDASRQRLGMHTGEGILFYSASEGSLVLCGVIAGVAAWILQQTLGETLKEAWLESELHRKLKRLLLAGSNYKAEGIAQGIEKRNTVSLGNQKKVALSANVQSEAGVTIIYVQANLQASTLPPLQRYSEGSSKRRTGSGRAAPSPMAAS